MRLIIALPKTRVHENPGDIKHARLKPTILGKCTLLLYRAYPAIS